MLEIAMHDVPEGIYQKDIAKNQEISIRYLDHIIAALKTKGLIINSRGRKSGYVLTRKPTDITLYDIHNAFEAGINIVDCLALSKECKKENSCASKFFWDELNTLIVNYLQNVTLQDLVDKHNELDL
jgi:Rrf2 family protein